MNPTVVELCVAVAAGLLAGLAAMLRRRKVARDVLPFLAPVTQWQRQLAEWNREDAGKRKEREAKRALEVDTLRSIYLADLAAAAERPEEVPAR